MAYLSHDALSGMGFKFIGKNVKISDKASVYNADLMEVGDNSRIDDFCVVSGRVSIGRNVHIAPMCLVAGGTEGVFLEDFSGLAYGVMVFSQSDDYSGETMTNPTIPAEYKREYRKRVYIRRHSIIGAASIVMPGVDMAEGTSVGAMSVVRKSTQEWTIYNGNPAKPLKQRSKKILELETEYMNKHG